MKCKFCKNEFTASLEPKSIQAYTIENSEKFSPWIIIEVRGAEPVDYRLAEDFHLSSSESNTKFENVNLSEGEWVEYDENAGLPVSVLDIETKITKLMKSLKKNIRIANYSGYYDLIIANPKSNLHSLLPKINVTSLESTKPNPEIQIQVLKDMRDNKSFYHQNTSDSNILPNPPGAEDCCQSGCSNCVWDIYAKDVNEYERKLSLNKHDNKTIIPEPYMDPSIQAFMELERKLKASKS
ncbi:hypothetical protein HK096_007221 [Nowakowskiella sp. JEL0078]|nr:hypothetical protein HK096_007221 [Nowakowskiella sp. JEL0078]